jgi:hypothetical protein
MCEDGHGDRRHAVSALEDGLDTVGREHLQRRALGRRGQGVRVFAHVERAINAPDAPVVADGLSDGQDVGLGERAAQRRAPVSAGAEADQLIQVARFGPALEMLPFEPCHVNQQLSERRDPRGEKSP